MSARCMCHIVRRSRLLPAPAVALLARLTRLSTSSVQLRCRSSPIVFLPVETWTRPSWRQDLSAFHYLIFLLFSQEILYRTVQQAPRI